MRIVEVRDRGAAAEFLSLPEALYADDPAWHDGAYLSIAADLAGESAFRRYAEMSAYLCLGEAGEPLGRIAAFLNPRLRDEGGRPLGQVGYFEAVDDPGAAGALFRAAGGWLAARGAAIAVGPMAGGAHRSHRLMTAGFDRSPFFAEPRGRPYYPRLFEAAGFSVLHRWASYDWTVAEVRAVMARVGPDAARARASGRWRLDHPELGRPDALFARLHALLDAVWSGHTGYASVDLAELAEGFGVLLAMMEEGTLAIAVDAATGRDLGLVIAWPDHLDAIRELGHDLARWRAWLAGQARALPQPRRAIPYMIAVTPESRRTGVSAWLLEDCFGRVLEAGYEEALIALVDETYTLFGKLTPPSRAYALYAGPLGT